LVTYSHDILDMLIKSEGIRKGNTKQLCLVSMHLIAFTAMSPWFHGLEFISCVIYFVLSKK